MRMTPEEYARYLSRQPQLTQKRYSQKRQRKFNNQPTDGADSGKEARRFADLQLMEKAGTISNLRQHVRFDICINGVFVCWYEADAVYVENGVTVAEDTKSPITQKHPMFRLKAKLMKAVHGIEIKIV